ncbi:unnamed protein product [Ostreobium quekettii]|uniref:Uncharacterized protein n=1 Tax=Ostreobium quekettii TaxID=121088 RepID=A0A8S1ISA7_9CHLO|nr:unnamed protein product [Ostreobium quekettii]
MGSPCRPGPPPTSNKNAYAGANIGVPWSPLEGVTSLDPRDYVWAPVPPAPGGHAGPQALQAAWWHLGAMAMLQGGPSGWPVPMPPGLAMPGLARAAMPACMPGFPIQYPGMWNPLQQVVPAQMHAQQQPSADGTPQGKTLGMSAEPAKKTAGGKSVDVQQTKKCMQKQKKGSAEALLPEGKCSEDFLDCMMDLNDEDLQQLLQEPLGTLANGGSQLDSPVGSPINVVSDSSDASSFSIQKSPSCGSQHSETLPDDSMLFLEGLDLSCLKEVNSFPDLTELECLNFDTACEEGMGKASKATSQLKKKKGGGVSKKKATKDRNAVPTFVDDECLKELERMLGTGPSAEALGNKLKGTSSSPSADVAMTTGNEKMKIAKNVRKSGSRKAAKTS